MKEFNGKKYETDHETLFSNCCRKLCKTEDMNENEFDEYTEEHCEDCPVGALEMYYNRKMEEYKKDLTMKIEKLINTK